MPAVLKDGKWIYRFTYKGTIYYSRKFLNGIKIENREEVLLAEEEKKKQIFDEEERIANRDKNLIYSKFDEMCKNGNIATSTLRTFTSFKNNFLNPIVGNITLDELTKEKYDEVLDAIDNKDACPKYKSKMRNAFFRFLNYYEVSYKIRDGRREDLYKEHAEFAIEQKLNFDDLKEGAVKVMRCGMKAKILCINSFTKIIYEFEDGIVTKPLSSLDFKNGTITHPYLTRIRDKYYSNDFYGYKVKSVKTESEQVFYKVFGKDNEILFIATLQELISEVKRNAKKL